MSVFTDDEMSVSTSQYVRAVKYYEVFSSYHTSISGAVVVDVGVPGNILSIWGRYSHDTWARTNTQLCGALGDCPRFAVTTHFWDIDGNSITPAEAWLAATRIDRQYFPTADVYSTEDTLSYMMPVGVRLAGKEPDCDVLTFQANLDAESLVEWLKNIEH